MQQIRRPTKQFSPSTPPPAPIHDLLPNYAEFTYIERRPSWGRGALLPWVYATLSVFIASALPVVGAGEWLLKYGTKETAISEKKVKSLKAKVM